MSWSIYKTGTVEEVVAAIEAQSNSLDGQSKEEYDAAMPSLITLVKENIGGTIDLQAYGHGSKNADGIYYDKSCAVQIRRV